MPTKRDKRVLVARTLLLICQSIFLGNISNKNLKFQDTLLTKILG